jgi:2,3-dihydroxy-p-cumate/2,3-dihydroxybenzoate 3,4-dioxygenase
MIKLCDLSYVRLGTENLGSTLQFATETLGLQLVRQENGRAYVRGDERDHDICYIEGGQDKHVLGFEALRTPRVTNLI